MFYKIANFNSGFGFMVYNDGSNIDDPMCEVVYGPMTDDSYVFFDTPEEARDAAELYLNPKKTVKTKQGIFSTFTPEMFLAYNKKCADILVVNPDDSDIQDMSEMQALIMKINYIMDFEFSDAEFETLNKIFELAGMEVK